MSQVSTPGTGSLRANPENDVCMALVIIAFLFVLLATVYVGYRAQALFDTLLPPAGS